RHLELIVATVLRPLVGTPPEELRSVPEARALHVIVGDLADALGPKRLPAQILAAIPPAGGAGQPLTGGTGFFLRFGPVAPRMPVERGLSERLQLVDQLLSRGIGERCRDTDVV